MRFATQHFSLLVALLTLFAANYSWAQTPAKSTKAVSKRAADDVYREDIVPLVKKFCLDCHGPAKQESDVSFHKYKSVELIAQDEKTWKTVIDMLRTGAMPPEDQPQPSQEEREKLIRWIEGTIYHVDCDAPPDPGRVTIRRLNRDEYNNTVRDLLVVDFKPADDFPSDDVGSGFDNIGDVLSLPPLLMEKYLAAAETIAEKTILATPPVKVAAEKREGKTLQGEGAAQLRDNRWAIVSAGAVKGEFTVPRAGEYALRAVASGELVCLAHARRCRDDELRKRLLAGGGRPGDGGGRGGAMLGAAPGRQQPCQPEACRYDGDRAQEGREHAADLRGYPRRRGL